MKNTSIDWDILIEQIKEQRCVLLLGPEFLSLNGLPLDKAMKQFLEVEKNKHVEFYYHKDDFFIFHQNSEDPEDPKLHIYRQMKRFYNQNFSEEDLLKVAQIPFHLIISLNPDLLLRNTFQKYQLPHQFSFYPQRQKPFAEVDSPTIEQPLIYNLGGSIEEDESLTLTYDDMYDFLLSSMVSPGLPHKLRFALEKAHSYVFLGFQFHKWHAQLLLRLLNLKKGTRYVPHSEVDVETKTFLIQQFKVKFIPNTYNFLEELYKNCKLAGILKEIEEGVSGVKQEVLRCIEKDELEKALSILKEYFAEMDEIDEVIMHSSRFNWLKKQIDKNTIDTRDALVEMSKIKNALIQLSNTIK